MTLTHGPQEGGPQVASFSRRITSSGRYRILLRGAKEKLDKMEQRKKKKELRRKVHAEKTKAARADKLQEMKATNPKTYEKMLKREQSRQKRMEQRFNSEKGS